MFNQKQRLVLFINKSQLVFYGGKIRKATVIPLSPEIIQDLEIINKDVLTKIVTTFLQTNKIPPSAVTILVSTSLLFSKNFPPVSTNYSSDQLQIDIETFLTYVPFQHPLSRTVTSPKGTTVIVTNGDIYNVFHQIFTSLNFTIESIAPLILLNPNIGDNFNSQVGQTALNKADWIKQNGFTINQDDLPTTDRDLEQPKKTSKKTILLFAIFFILVIVLIVMLLLQSNKQQTAKSQNINPTSTQGKKAPVLSATLSPSPSPTASKKDIAIQVLNGSGRPGAAEELKNLLKEKGFSSISTGNAPNITLNKTLVVFSSRVDEATKTAIVEIVKEQFTDISLQTNSTIQADVIITIAK